MKSKFAVFVKDKSSPIDIEYKTWSGGEVSVCIRDIETVASNESFDINSLLFDSDGVMTLLLLVDAIRKINKCAKLSLFMGYVPYGRQDRVCNVGESFSLKVFSNLINSLDFDEVVVLDPHSQVTTALIDNCRSYYPSLVISELLDITNNWVVVAPDAGAVKRAESVAKGLGCPLIYSTKTRDQRTGEITGGRLDFAGVNVAGKDLLVVDDICDGGRTFISLAKMIEHELNGCNSSLSLLVSHGIFSYGTDTLSEIYDNIFVINPFPGIENPDNLTILN